VEHGAHGRRILPAPCAPRAGNSAEGGRHPDNVADWEDFIAGKIAGNGTVAREAKEDSLADLLLRAIDLAAMRRGRISQAERIREQTLLEVLAAAVNRKGSKC
jgi:hypothetical protein